MLTVSVPYTLMKYQGPQASQGAEKPELLSIEDILRSCSMLGAGADLAFLVMAAQIQQIEGDVRAALEEMDRVKKLRDSLGAEIRELQDLKKLIEATNHEGDKDGNAALWEMMCHGGYLKGITLNGSVNATKWPDYLDKITCPGGPQGGVISLDPGDPDFSAKLQQAFPGRLDLDVDLARKYLGALQAFCKDHPLMQHKLSLDAKTGAVNRSDDGALWKWEPEHGFRLGQGDVDCYLNKLQNEASALDSDRDIKNILLNQQLNRKEQVVTQLTNMLKKTHDTRTAVIANLR